MDHNELRQLAGAQIGIETEEQAEFRRERAKRLLDLASRYGRTERLAGISLDQLAAMPPAFAVARLGLPSSVLLDELRRLQPITGFVPPPSMLGRSNGK